MLAGRILHQRKVKGEEGGRVVVVVVIVVVVVVLVGCLLLVFCFIMKIFFFFFFFQFTLCTSVAFKKCILVKTENGIVILQPKTLNVGCLSWR